MKKSLITFLVLVLGMSSLGAQEIKEGLMKLVIDQSTSSFRLYYLSDVEANEYVPLLLEKDSRTTFFDLLIDNEIIRPGYARAYQQEVFETPKGGRYVWTSRSFRITEDFEFIRSEDSTLANGLMIKIRVENLSEDSHLIGLRYVFDTFQGESGNVHFQTDKYSTIIRESLFSRSMPEYWVSAQGEKTPPALQGMTSGEGVTVPDKLIMANWKRLHDSPWIYVANPERNFNHLPYSINDSAVAHFYEPRRIKTGEAFEVNLALGVYSPGGFDGVERPLTEINEIFNRTERFSADDLKELEKDIILLTDLIDQVNKKVLLGESVNKEELRVMQSVLVRLNQKKDRYRLPGE